MSDSYDTLPHLHALAHTVPSARNAFPSLPCLRLTAQLRALSWGLFQLSLSCPALCHSPGYCMAGVELPSKPGCSGPGFLKTFWDPIPPCTSSGRAGSVGGSGQSSPLRASQEVLQQTQRSPWRAEGFVEGKEDRDGARGVQPDRRGSQAGRRRLG